jgi:hypothetical protein
MQEDIRSRAAGSIPPDLRAVFNSYKKKGLLVPPERPASMIAYLCTERAGNVNGRVLGAEEVEALLRR